MAPIPSREAVVMQPQSSLVCFKAAKLEAQPSVAIGNSRIKRCSSVSSEEEESLLVGRTDRSSLFAMSMSMSIKKTRTFAGMFTVCNTNSATGTLNTAWPGVMSGLEEDERPVKVKEKCPLEPEEKKLAVENDDDSSNSSSTSESSLFELDEKYLSLNLWTGPQIPSKSVKCEVKTREICKSNDLLLVPLSIQETEHFREDVEIHCEKTLLSPSSDSSDVKYKEDASSSNEDWAEVQVEEVELNIKYEKDGKCKDTKPKNTSRRHAVRKVKRSIWCISEPEPPPIQIKRKKTNRQANKRKHRQQQRDQSDKRTIPEVKKTLTTTAKAKKRKIPASPVREEPRDSGVHSGGANSSCGDSNSSSSASSNGSFSPGGSGTGGSGTQGTGGDDDNGDDGEKRGKFPWWHLPDSDHNPVPDREKEEEEKEDEDHEEMELDIPATGFQMFLPSKVDNPEQCHGPGGGELLTTDTKITFLPQDIQHACYCSSTVCRNMNCKYVKSEVEHIRDHQDWKQCPRCAITRDIIEQHAKSCCRRGCRVPDCDAIRKRNGANCNTGKPVPFVREPAQAPCPEAWIAHSLYYTPLAWSQIDGKVIFRNAPFLPPEYFAEHVDYNVNRKDLLGGGSNGKIYPVYLRSDRSKQIVVKETNYQIAPEEMEVYKLLGDHENIVKHYGGTFRGSQGHASIFMEKCDVCLYDYMEEVLKRRLSVNEAMFFWPQVVDAVFHLHSRPTPVIHKDIKAKNVLLSDEYTRAKLADFDSARRVPDEFTQAGLKPLGTKGFASPEVLASSPHGRPSDVYSLGCFLIEITVGVPSQETLHEKINRLQELDRDLAQLVRACVRERPEERPTAQSLLESLVVKKYSRS